MSEKPGTVYNFFSSRTWERKGHQKGATSPSRGERGKKLRFYRQRRGLRMETLAVFVLVGVCIACTSTKGHKYWLPRCLQVSPGVSRCLQVSPGVLLKSDDKMLMVTICSAQSCSDNPHCERLRMCSAHVLVLLSTLLLRRHLGRGRSRGEGREGGKAKGGLKGQLAALFF